MRYSSRHFVAISILALVLSSPPAAEGRQQGAPSTPEERQQAVALIRELEAKPLAEPAAKAREWLILWLADIPDIEVRFCPSELLGGELKGKGKKLRDLEAPLSVQIALGSLAFLIENPEQAGDRAAAYLAGVESLLRTYQNLLSVRPEARFRLLDDLLETQKAGGLAALIAERSKKCFGG